MKMTGPSVDFLIGMNPELCGQCMAHENGKKVMCTQVSHAIHGVLIAAMLWHEKFCEDLEAEGFAFNPCNPCVANKTANGKQHWK